MKQTGNPIDRLLLILLILPISTFVHAQTTTIKGAVRDAVTRQPLSFVSVYFKGAKGVTSDENGNYSLSTGNLKLTVLRFSFGGYQEVSRTITPGTAQEIDIDLEPVAMKEVRVNNKKNKYRNKDNPAVDLIRKVIEHKNSNRMEAYQTASYEKYEKLQVSVNKASDSKLAKNKLFKPYRFLVENGDTSKLEGRVLSPVYLEETLSDIYYRKDPEKTKTIVKGKRRVDFGEFMDMQGISMYLNRLYQDFNVYDNNISVFTNLFLSPIADMGPTFYMYYISDTAMVNDQKLVRLYFKPRNPNDLLFRGNMWITLDGNYAIQKLQLLVSKSINFNFVREMKIDQAFEKQPDGRYLLQKSNVLGDFGINKSGTGLFGERTVSFKNFHTNQLIPDSVFQGTPLVLVDSAASHKEDYWQVYRHDSLTMAESKVYANVDSLQRMKSFRRLMDYGTLLLAGYKQAGIFEIGPASTFYSFNPVEGFRLRFGGRTNLHFSNRYYTEAYAAYGFKDQQWKYFLSGTYSLNNKSIYSFPQNYIRATYQKDIKIPGQELQFVAEDNFLLSFKRGNNDKWLYNKTFRFDHKREFGDHFSYMLGFKWWQQQPAGAISYIKNFNADTIRNITTSELSAEFRWAPQEQFYIGKLYRVPIVNKYPIMTLRYIAGIKGLFGGEYTYHHLNGEIFKRFYEGPLGYTDITLEGGYVFGKAAWPLLDIHRANQTYAYQLSSYNLMNFMEFISDRYAGVMFDHYFNGFFFNKIPLLKKLKWREVIEAKVLYGGLKDENNPVKNSGLLQFPPTNGIMQTFSLDNRPYIEAGVGIANIFKLIRLDFIKRFTYLEHPEIAEWGIRGRVKFDF